MTKKLPEYQSYLIRLRPSHRGTTQIWRVSLTHIQSGEEQHFSDLDACLSFLRDRFPEEKKGKY